MKKSAKKLFKVLDILLSIIASATFVLAMILIFLLPTSPIGSIFNNSFGIVQSGSMAASGYEIGDAVSIEGKDYFTVGDVIAFYSSAPLYDEAFDEETASEYRIIMHEVIGVQFIDGEKRFLTKGSSNASNDGYWIPEDFVIGVVTPLPKAINSFFRFLFTGPGIITIIVVPCMISLGLLLVDLIKNIMKLPLNEKDAKRKAERDERKALAKQLKLGNTGDGTNINPDVTDVVTETDIVYDSNDNSPDANIVSDPTDTAVGEITPEQAEDVITDTLETISDVAIPVAVITTAEVAKKSKSKGRKGATSAKPKALVVMPTSKQLDKSKDNMPTEITPEDAIVIKTEITPEKTIVINTEIAPEDAIVIKTEIAPEKVDKIAPKTVKPKANKANKTIPIKTTPAKTTKTAESEVEVKDAKPKVVANKTATVKKKTTPTKTK